MPHKLTSTLLALAALLLLVAGSCDSENGGGDTAPAIGAPYLNNFDGASPFDGWLFYDPNDAETAPTSTLPTLWHSDGAPSAIPGGPAHSGTGSLNYNDDVDYDTGNTNAGVSLTPKVDISPVAQPILAFWCNYKTEDTGANYDKRVVKIGKLNDDGTQTIYYEETLATDTGVCAAIGTWHEHVVPMDPSWGEVRVAFGFDTVDFINNGHEGWFVDDIYIGEMADYFSGSLPGDGDVDPGTGDAGTGDIGSGDSGTGSTGGDSGPSDTGATSGSATGSSGSTTGGSTTGGGGTTDGWTFEGGAENVAWAIDGTAADMPGGAAHTGDDSLNFNDGADYDAEGAACAGTATSPVLATAGASTIAFWCNYETETTGVDFDQRRVAISNDGFATTLFELQLCEAEGCAAMGVWHLHEIPVDPAWGDVQVRFSFDTVDELSNNFRGWYVDDLEVVTPVATGGGTTTTVTASPLKAPITAAGTKSNAGGGSGPMCSTGSAPLSSPYPLMIAALLALAFTFRRD